MPLLQRVKRWVRGDRLRPISKAVREDGLTYLSTLKLQRIEYGLYLIKHEQIPGDILEFGVALGGSAIVLASDATTDRHFHGFDVFEMIPPPTSEKDDEVSRQRYEVIKSGASAGIGGTEYYGYRDNLYEDVKASFAKHGQPVDGDRVQLHKGLFEDTVPHADIQQIALAHIDCDWYDPVKYCLDYVDARMGSGGIIVLDDYHAYGGARTAVHEFMDAHPEYRFDDGPNPILRKDIPFLKA